MRKGIWVMILCIWCILLAGCGHKTEVVEQKNIPIYYENSQVFRLPGNHYAFTLMGMGDKHFYYHYTEVVTKDGEEYQDEICIYKQAMEQGSEPVKLELSLGNLLLRNSLITTDATGKDRIVLLLGEEEDGKLQYALYEYDEEGKLLATVSLQATDIQGDYPEQFQKLQDGSFAVISKRYFFVTSAEGETLFSVPCPGVEYLGLVEASPEQIAVTYAETEGGKVTLAFVESEKKTISHETTITGDGRRLCLGQDKIVYVDEKGIYQYEPTAGIASKAVGLGGRNIDIHQVVDIQMKKENFLLLGYSTDGKAVKCITYTTGMGEESAEGEESTKADAEKYDAYGRRYIYLYDYTGDWPKYSDNPIDAFNEQSDTYQVVLKDYGYDQTGEDTYDMAKIVAAGDYPDLIFSTYNSLIAGFEEKGALEDLTPYVNASEKLSIEDLSETIVNAYTDEGKLFALPSTFYLSALYGSQKYLGEAGWTVDEFLNWLSIHPSPGPVGTRTAIYDACIPAVLERCIDWEKGKASFDGEVFKSFITKLKALHREKVYSREELMVSLEMMEIDEAALEQTISSPSHYISVENEKEVDMVIKGYPSEDGTPRAYIDSGALSIMNTSDVKEGAYEFLEFYLLYRAGEYDSKRYGVSRFWTVKDRMEEDMEGLLHADNYMGEPCAFSERQIEEVMSIIPYAVLRDCAHTELEQLIEEELEPFFENQKDVDTVCKVIQNRVQLYLDERGK